MTSRSRSLRGLVAAGILALALAACGSTDAGTAAPADDAARCLPEAVACDDTPGEDEPGDAMVPEEIALADAVPPDARPATMSDEATEVWPVFLQSAVVDGDQVTVTFSGGDAPCFVVDHLETDETDERVIVSVFVGSADPEADCTEQRISTQTLSFDLEEPLGDRPLKDGSRTVPDGAQG